MNEQTDVCVALDFETSGRESYAACSIGLVRIEGMRLCEPFYTVLRPPSPMMLFTEIHGLTWNDVRNGPVFAEAWDSIAKYCEGASFFVAHNAPFDRRILRACLAYAGLPPNPIPFLCTLKGSRRALPRLASHSLDSLCNYFSLPLLHHHAGSDALACGMIYVRLCSMGIQQDTMRVKG
ncbi:MAG: 3'-5' exoribonuclease [Desulfovibrionaceae bacterium]|nr:3'-5' exoribonuclease [Desulfovibrionaceae bacterium]